MKMILSFTFLLCVASLARGYPAVEEKNTTDVPNYGTSHFQVFEIGFSNATEKDDGSVEEEITVLEFNFPPVFQAFLNSSGNTSNSTTQATVDKITEKDGSTKAKRSNNEDDESEESEESKESDEENDGHFALASSDGHTTEIHTVKPDDVTTSSTDIIPATEGSKNKTDGSFHRSGVTDSSLESSPLSTTETHPIANKSSGSNDTVGNGSKILKTRSTSEDDFSGTFNLGHYNDNRQSGFVPSRFNSNFSSTSNFSGIASNSSGFVTPSRNFTSNSSVFAIPSRNSASNSSIFATPSVHFASNSSVFASNHSFSASPTVTGSQSGGPAFASSSRGHDPNSTFSSANPNFRVNFHDNEDKSRISGPNPGESDDAPLVFGVGSHHPASVTPTGSIYGQPTAFTPSTSIDGENTTKVSVVHSVSFSDRNSTLAGSHLRFNSTLRGDNATSSSAPIHFGVDSSDDSAQHSRFQRDADDVPHLAPHVTSGSSSSGNASHALASDAGQTSDSVGTSHHGSGTLDVFSSASPSGSPHARNQDSDVSGPNPGNAFDSPTPVGFSTSTLRPAFTSEHPKDIIYRRPAPFAPNSPNASLDTTDHFLGGNSTRDDNHFGPQSDFRGDSSTSTSSSTSTFSASRPGLAQSDNFPAPQHTRFQRDSDNSSPLHADLTSGVVPHSAEETIKDANTDDDAAVTKPLGTATKITETDTEK
ncbi:dentin sialophosphoprotein [Hyalella azteca]|uniref:Dentin sialophosphoprotein n=1 Tax=Hyalella azteca TaxID=294128 RepID=A0A8B7N448_HYAAZ|nr:dentin sialophosphoprotein [Hyalella azteca]